MAMWPRRLALAAATTALLVAGCETTTPDEAAPPPDDRPANGDPANGDDPDGTPNGDDPGDASGDGRATEGTWAQLPEAPIATRINHSATWTGDLIVVWGGEDQDTLEITADGAAFDPATDRWHDIPEAPIEPRWAHEAVWTGEELLVWGGTAGPDHLAACYGDGARYDPAADAWETIPELPGETRCGASVAWTGDELIVSGGHAGEGPPGPGDRHDDALAYEPDGDGWRTLPDSPLGPRAGAVTGWVAEELVVYGGHTRAEDDGFAYLADGAAYDPGEDAWRELPDSPLPTLSGIHAAVVDDRLLVLGGQDPAPEADERATATVAYDPDADTWETLADMPGAHDTLASAWTGDVLYVLGGGLPDPGEGDVTDDRAPPFLAYVADEDLWLPREDPPGGYRTHHAMAWTGAELIVWGGQHDDGPADGLRWTPPTGSPTDAPPPEDPPRDDPAALPAVELSAWVEEAPANLNHRIEGTVTDASGDGESGVPVRFEVHRDDTPVLAVDRETEADGEVLFSYNAGARDGDTDVVVACVLDPEDHDHAGAATGTDATNDAGSLCTREGTRENAQEAEEDGDEPAVDPTEDPSARAVTVTWREEQQADREPAGSDFFGEAIAIDPEEQVLEVQLLPLAAKLGAFVAFDYTDDADYEVEGEPVSVETFACAVERTVADDAAEQRVTVSLTPPEVMRYLLTSSADIDDCL